MSRGAVTVSVDACTRLEVAGGRARVVARCWGVCIRVRKVRALSRRCTYCDPHLASTRTSLGAILSLALPLFARSVYTDADRNAPDRENCHVLVPAAHQRSPSDARIRASQQYPPATCAQPPTREERSCCQWSWRNVRPRLDEEGRLRVREPKLPVKEALLSKNTSSGQLAMTSLSAIRSPYTFLPSRSSGATI